MANVYAEEARIVVEEELVSAPDAKIAFDIGKFGIKRGDSGYIFAIEVKNEGETYLIPSGGITIIGEDGSEYEVAIEKGFPLLPASALTYAVRWDMTDLAPGEYEARVRLDYGGAKMAEKSMRFIVE